jgi:hypothetical protein
METIKNYLDSMFLSLPNTNEVKRMKEELLQMMEDKYTELKASGKTENECIGIVIAEFGNIEELKEGLNLSPSVDLSKTTKTNQKTYPVTLTDAQQFIAATKKSSFWVTIATMLCIISPSALILLMTIAETASDKAHENIFIFAGIISLFLLIASAVAIYIINDNFMAPYKQLRKNILHLDEAAVSYINDLRELTRTFYSTQTVIGTILCILCVFPLFIAGIFDIQGDIVYSIGVCILLLMVSSSMIFFIPQSMQKEAYQILLQEGAFEKKNKSAFVKAISTFFWSVMTILYLGWSFTSQNWEITWIIWPIAGILYSGISSILTATSKTE